MRFNLPEARILDFDTESRPLSWLSQDFVTSELTAIGASFGIGEPLHSWALGIHEPEEMLEGFLTMWNMADIVTGHYIIRHDLPRINASLAEYGFEELPAKMVSDTQSHLTKVQGVSKSQQNLAELLGVDSPKVGMSQGQWRRANRLDAVHLTLRRVEGDVRQHQELRLALIEGGLLGAPRMWSPKHEA